MENNICTIYFTSKEKVHAIESNLIDSFENTFLQKKVEYDICKNMDYDTDKQSLFPDGFLFFRYMLIVESNELIKDDFSNLLSSILMWFWNNNIPAIASYDYENELVKKGGYNDKTIPFP